MADSNIDSHAYLFRFMSELNDEEKENLVKQRNSINTENIINHFRISKQRFNKAKHTLTAIDNEHYAIRQCLPDEQLSSYWNKGLRAIAEGKVAAVVLAGGQATRLGASKPKGVLELGLETPDCNSLFALQAARIARLQVLAAKQFPSYRPIIHWIIMTSASTEADTKRHLEEIAQMSELTMDQITIFNQGELPCITFDEKLILSSKSKIATAPDGNGGLYEAIRPHLPRFRSIGIRYFHVYCVDNILCRVADPHFIGYCIEKNADCAAKVVEKVDPGERVGVICKEDGKIKVIEYTELPRDLAEKRTESGKLVFRAGNIANHFFSLEFLEKVCSDDYPIIYHLAFKKIPFVDENGTIIKPNSENGYKLEKFIFDVFEFSQNFFVWEVPRAEEFSPLKNAENAGKECLSTCLRDLFAEHRRWLKCKSDDDRNLFVHPKLSYAGEDFP